MVVSRGMRSPKREVLNVAVGDSSRIITVNYVFGSPLSQQPVVWNEFSPGDLLGAAPDTERATSFQFSPLWCCYFQPQGSWRFLGFFLRLRHEGLRCVTSHVWAVRGAWDRECPWSIVHDYGSSFLAPILRRKRGLYFDTSSSETNCSNNYYSCVEKHVF